MILFVYKDMAEFFNKLLGISKDGFASVKIKNGLNPSIKACIGITIPAMAIVSILNFFNINIIPSFLIVLYIVLLSPILIYVFTSVIFILFDRDKLQSEEWQYRNRTLDIIEQKGGDVQIEPASLNIISRPKPINGGKRK